MHSGILPQQELGRVEKRTWPNRKNSRPYNGKTLIIFGNQLFCSCFRSVPHLFHTKFNHVINLFHTKFNNFNYEQVGLVCITPNYVQVGLVCITPNLYNMMCRVCDMIIAHGGKKNRSPLHHISFGKESYRIYSIPIQPYYSLFPFQI